MVRRPSTRTIVASLVLALGLSGCLWALEPPSWSIQAEASPPYPHAEYVPPAPGPGFIWIDGYWHWNGAQYVWLRGYWSRPPVVGYVWAPSGWILVDGSYRFYAGRWVHPSYRSSVTYVRTRVPPQPSTTYRSQPRSSGSRATPAPPAPPPASTQKAKPR